jgi:hypothetical protein
MNKVYLSFFNFKEMTISNYYFNLIFLHDKPMASAGG